MNNLNRATLFLVMALGVVAVLQGRAVRAQHAKKIETPAPMQAVAGQACPTGLDEAYLDINNVRARVFNNGALFWRWDKGPSVYEVPKGGGENAVFAASLWVAGTVAGQLRAASTNYGVYEFWPGPLDEAGNPPTDCAAFDRIYNVSVRDFLLYDQYGLLTPSLRDWPHHLGAPVRDGDGLPDNYNLEGGDRPELLGHQTLWWIMNDLGGEHTKSKTPPVGLEVEATAFAVASDEAALDNTTFYRFRIRYRGTEPLENAYVALFTDVDLGNFDDDFSGADTTLGMAIGYNSDDDDTGYRGSGYGAAPPAVGVDFVQGPLIDPDGKDNDRDGLVDEPGERLMMTGFVFNNDVEEGYGGQVLYNHMRGRWHTGEPIIDGCVWPQPEYCDPSSSGDTTGIMVPGDPVTRQFWSEMNYWQGEPNEASDRKMMLSSGPFTMQPGDEQEIVIAIVWARGNDHLDSVTRLREADRIVQAAWDDGLNLPLPSRAPVSESPRAIAPANRATGQPTNLTLRWQGAEGADAYLLEVARDPEFTTGIKTMVSRTSFDTEELMEVAGNTSILLDTLSQNTTYYWRLRGINTTSLGPPSPIYQFSTSDAMIRHGEVLRLSNGTPAFVEITGPGGTDPCGATAQNTFGCDEVGGNLVWNSFNSDSSYILSANPWQLGYIEFYIDRELGPHAPSDFEFRFTEEGSYAVTSDNGVYYLIDVPFEVWDIGSTPPLTVNDPSDDVRVVPVIGSFRADGNPLFGYASEIKDPLGLGWPVTDYIKASYLAPGHTYQDWAAFAAPLVEAHPSRTPIVDKDTVDTFIEPAHKGPLGQVKFVFYGNQTSPKYRPEGPPEGTVIRLYTTTFGLSRPILSAPGNGITGLFQPITLWWNAPIKENWRHLKNHFQVSTTDDFTAVVAQDTVLQDFFTLPDLTMGQPYFWRVRVQYQRGAFSPWSEVWRFRAGLPTAVEAPEPGVPATYTLQPNYPNPFNPTTTIGFGVPRVGRVWLEVYDVLGRKVATLLDDVLPAGWHEVRWDAAGLSSGVYFYRMQAGGFQTVRTMLLVR